MIADALDNPPRSLVQYAEELRLQVSALDGFRALTKLGKRDRARLARRLLAVEREINWRMGI